MNVIGLDAFTPGETEFVFGLPFLLRSRAARRFAIVSANIVDPATGERIFGAPYVIKTLKGGLRVAITGVLDDAIRFPAYIDTSKFRVLPAIETVRRLVPEMRGRKRIFCSAQPYGNGTLRPSSRGRCRGFDLVVVGHGKPVIKSSRSREKSIMLATGGSGQYMGRIDLSLSAAGVIEEGQMKLIPLDDSIPLNQEVESVHAVRRSRSRTRRATRKSERRLRFSRGDGPLTRCYPCN